MITLPSPFGAGRNTPKLLVIHAMGEFIHDGNYYFAPDYLQKQGLSCHYLMTPSGVLIKTRSEDQTAWHAKGFNTDSIGIEFLVSGVHTYESFLLAIEKPWLTTKQLEAGRWFVSDIKKRYPGIEVKGHSDLSPERKKDPGNGFNWKYIMSET